MLTDLGPELEMLGQSSVLEPTDAPQYRRTTLRCRMSFFETDWESNRGLIEQLTDALKTNQGVLLWEDDDGNAVVNRRVIVGPNNLPDLNAQGTYRQVAEFSFQYLEFPATDGIVPQTLPATFQRAGGPVITLSTVEKWTETLDTRLYSEWRSDRARVSGTVSASGKILGNSLASLGASQNGLFAAKDQLMAQIAASDQGTLIFGSFNQIVRGLKFDAQPDQAQDMIRWTLHGQFTRAPSEANYSQIDLGVETRDELERGTQGQTTLVLSGKIEAQSAVAGYLALSQMQLALVPSNYTLIEDANTERIVAGVDAAPSLGGTFIDLTVREVYRENKTGLVTWTPDENTQGGTQTLGIVVTFTDGYTAQLFSEMRNQRQRAGGNVEMTGRYQLGPDDEVSELYETAATWKGLMKSNSSGTLAYGTMFSQDVRIISFQPTVKEAIMAIEWTLVAHYTLFPNETGYAVADFRVKTSSVNTDGAVELMLTGKVEAQSEAAALACLAQIRTNAVPSGYVTLEMDADSRTVQADADGTTFLELTFAEKYRLTQGNIVTWELKILTSTDTKTGDVRTVYSGSVSATGTTLGQAYEAGLAQAQTLGAAKGSMLMRSDISQTQKLFLTSGNVFVAVDFAYEYLGKGTAVYIEATAEIADEAFGQDMTVVRGFVAGPTNAACKAAYLTNVRNIGLHAGLLVLSEKHAYSKASIVGQASLDVRFDFVLTLHRTKQSSETAMQFSLQITQDFVQLEQVTEIEGVVYAGSAGVAQAFLAAFLAAGNYGTVQTKGVTRQRSQTGRNAGGSPQTDFFALEFGQTFVSILSGAATVLESQVTVSVTYAGNRWIEQAIPGAVSIMQNTGIAAGKRRVTGRVRAATLLAAQTWASAQHGFISGDPAGAFELPPEVDTGYEFLPLTVGVASGTGQNVKVYSVGFSYSEALPTLTYGG